MQTSSQQKRKEKKLYDTDSHVGASRSHQRGRWGQQTQVKQPGMINEREQGAGEPRSRLGREMSMNVTAPVRDGLYCR
jgi:hypothetical protein